jgi:hypothetical protein
MSPLGSITALAANFVDSGELILLVFKLANPSAD